MIICFFGDTAADHLRRWSTYFAQRGHTVHVVTFNNVVNGAYKGVQINYIRKSFAGDSIIARALNVLPMLWKLKRLLAWMHPHLIHSHSAGAYSWIPMFLRFRPLLITPWGNDILIDIEHSKVERFFTIRALQYADAIVCDGMNVQEVIVKLGIRPQKIRFITFGVDVQRFVPSRDKEGVRRQLNLVGLKIVLSTRILSSVHDVETLIRAVPLVLQHIRDVEFVIVGWGPQAEYLKSLARELGIEQLLRFIGRVTEEDMVQYLQAADVYVSTSLSESGLAGSTAEAMACGLPVVNTDTGDIRLWLEDGKGGCIIPTQNPQVLAERIIYLLQQGAQLPQWGLQNRAVIEERNNYYKEMEKMEHIYYEVSKKDESYEK